MTIEARKQHYYNELVRIPPKVLADRIAVMLANIAVAHEQLDSKGVCNDLKRTAQFILYGQMGA